MKSVNKVTILGNITKDPELKYTTTGVAVATWARTRRAGRDASMSTSAVSHRLWADEECPLGKTTPAPPDRDALSENLPPCATSTTRCTTLRGW